MDGARGPLNDGYWFENAIDNRDAGRGLLAFLSAHFPYRDWPTLLARGSVHVNGVAAIAPEVALRAGDIVRFFKEPWHEPLVDTRFDVAFEDDELIVCIKRKVCEFARLTTFLTSPGRATRLCRTAISCARRSSTLCATRDILTLRRCIASGAAQRAPSCLPNTTRPPRSGAAASLSVP